MPIITLDKLHAPRPPCEYYVESFESASKISDRYEISQFPCYPGFQECASLGSRMMLRQAFSILESKVYKMIWRIIIKAKKGEKKKKKIFYVQSSN